jgi:hypothetical protein
VQQLIEHRRSLPPDEQIDSVRTYFDTPVALPAWADPQLLQQGRRFFNVYGVHIASALFTASLPLSYTAVDGAQVLIRTAELVSHTRRRIAQTGEMLLDVMGANDPPGSVPFAPDTASFRAPHGVRLFHAAVRHMLAHDPAYDREQLGEPINQEDLLGTLLTFSVVVLDALQRFGVPLDERDRDGYTRLWLTAGYLLGIDPDLLRSREHDGDVPLTYDELVTLRDLIMQRHAGASDAGQALMAALLEEQTASLPLLLRGLPRATTRYLIGPTNATHLAIPNAGVTGLLLRPLPLVNRVVFGRVYYDLAGWLFAKLARDMYRAWIARASGPGPNPWRYDAVVRPWKLEATRTRARRVARHPVRATRERLHDRTAFALR